MSFMIPHSKHFFVKPQTNGEELTSVARDSLGFPDASAGGSALEATPVYDQVRKVLHYG